MSNYTRSGVNIDTYFQTFSLNCRTAVATNLRNSNVDLNARYAGRDNRPGNAVTAIATTGFTVGGSDIVSRFNRAGAIFDVTIGGTTTYNGFGQTASITSFSPTNLPITPTISGSVTNAGPYTSSSFTVGANIPPTYTKNITGTYTILKRDPYDTYSFDGAYLNPNDGNTYKIYLVISNLVASDSITVSLASGNGIFRIGTEWTTASRTTSSPSGSPFADGSGTIYFGVLEGGFSAFFTINSAGNTNYNSPLLELT